MRFNACRVLPVWAAIVIAGCGGLSDVGNQENDDTAPTADAVVLNQPFSKDASGNVTTRVRSGAEVFLSGNDSDGTVAPVLTLEWALVTTGDVASQVHLVDRNSSTVSFKAPQVSADTALQFRLTVTDSNGNTDEADVNVTVVAAADPDRFLTHLQAPQKFTVVAVADTGTALTADVPFEIRLQRTITYVDLRGLSRTMTPAPETLQGVWLAAEGAGAACEDPQNPRFAVDLPKLDVNALAAAVRADGTRSASELPDLSRIDAASTQVEFGIHQTGALLPGSGQALLCVVDAAGGLLPADAVQSLSGGTSRAGSYLSSFSVDAHRLTGTMQGAAARTVDTRDTAQAYYATIDDAAAAQRKRSFLGWLKDNGFVPQEATTLQWSQIESGSTAHAVYVNNFDLGFGRDMYARRFDCVDPRSTTGECVASVVVNYSSLEAAAKKLDPIVAVAMEYATTPHSNGRRVVKFYTYAPNEVNGDFDRINSVDLDGRGEKFMPGACTICHGGTPLGTDPQDPALYAGGGDLNATFLPWDLESFLYSDSQAAGWVPDATDARETSLHARFTRSAQEGQLRELNLLAYQTYVDDPAHPGRYDLARDLVEAWYGDAVDSTTFQNRVPEQWGSDPDAGTLYHQVFAQHCRMCHVAHVPSIDSQTGAYQPYLGCNSTPAITQYSSNTAGQIAFGCYDQFIAASNLISVIQRGVMPNARLTMDRFWVNGGSGDSAATVLARHLQAATGRGDLLQADNTAAPPGRPVLSVSINGIQARTEPVEVLRNAPVRVDATATQFAGAYAWELCRASTPQSDCVALPLVGAMTAQPHFIPRGAGDYRLTLAATSSLNVVTTQTYVAHVENLTPNIDSCPTEQAAANAVEQTIPLTCIEDGDGESTIQLRDPVTQAWVDAIAVSGQYQANVADQALVITYTEEATTPAVLSYRVCDIDPEDCAAGAIQVNIASTLTAVDDVVNACLSNAIDTACFPLPRAIAVDDLLLNDVVRPINDAVTLTVTQPATGSVTPASAQRGESFDYAVTQVLCDINGTDIEDGGDCADRFSYTITSQDGVTQATAEVSVFVRATTSFSQGAQAIHDMFESNCAGCHNGTTGGGARWTLGPVGEESDPAATLQSIKDNDLHIAGDSTPAPIVAAPCTLHFGARRLDEQQCLIVTQWLSEGAHLR